MTEHKNETRDDKYLRQTSELYEGIGRFVAAFELIVDAMRTQLLFVWSPGGVQNQVLFQPALAELTAHPIKNVFVATMAESLRMRIQDEAQRAEAEKVLGHIASRLSKMIEVRNEIVHGTWLIGWASEQDTDFSVAGGYKPKNTGRGVEHRDIGRTKDEFYRLVDDCNMLTCLVNRFAGVARSDRSWTANFPWDGKVIRLPPSMWTFTPLSPNYEG